MDKQKSPRTPRKRKNAKTAKLTGKSISDATQPTQNEGGNDEHQVHKDILMRRMVGGLDATPDAYARGLAQWKELPGSIIRPATDVNAPPDDEPTKPDDNQNDQEPQP